MSNLLDGGFESPSSSPFAQSPSFEAKACVFKPSDFFHTKVEKATSLFLKGGAHKKRTITH